MFSNTLVASDNSWMLWAIIITAAAFGVWAEKTRLGSKLSAVVITILVTFILSNLSIIPTESQTYDIVWSYLVPLAIPLLLFKANIARIIKESGPTLIAFVIGGIGTVTGTIIAYSIVNMGEEGWKIAGIFCSTYVGGSMNYVAAAEALQLKSADLLTAGIAADNLVMTLYFLLLFAIPAIKWITKFFPERKLIDEDSKFYEENSDEHKLTVYDLGTSLAITFVICALGFAFQDVLGISGSGILIITAIIVALASIFSKQFDSIRGADKIGTFFMQIFFAAIGASANIGIVLKVGPVLFIFAAMILSCHLIFLLFFGRMLKLDIREIVIASNANMGGPTTAAAMAVARKWHALVIPAILCGTLGYAIATFIGVGVAHLIR